MTPPRMEDSGLAGKSAIHELCRRVEQAKSRRTLYSALDDFTAYLTWLKEGRSKPELEDLCKRVADATDEETLFAALDDITAYLSDHCNRVVRDPPTDAQIEPQVGGREPTMSLP